MNRNCRPPDRSADGLGVVDVKALKGGEPEGVTTSPDGRFVYVPSEEGNTISVIDTAANKMIKQFAVGARPRDSAFSPDGSRAYVTAENGATVSVVDTASRVARGLH